jgi:hypothetical protein
MALDTSARPLNRAKFINKLSNLYIISFLYRIMKVVFVPSINSKWEIREISIRKPYIIYLYNFTKYIIHSLQIINNKYLLTVVAILIISFGLLHFITNTQFIEYAMAYNVTNETKNTNTNTNNNTIPISTFEKENVKNFIYQYFLLFDKKADVNNILNLFSDTGLKLEFFPDVTINNKKELAEWYKNLIDTYANISHTIQKIDVTKNYNGSFNVNVTLHGILQPTNGNTTDYIFFDTFTITPSKNNNYLIDYQSVKILEEKIR